MVDILAGRVIPLRLGYVPVLNRGQRDIDASKAIQRALDAERSTIMLIKAKAQYCGAPFLVRKLNIVCVRSQVMTKPFDAGGLFRS